MARYRTAKSSVEGYVTVFEGFTRKTLVYGSNTLLTELRLAKGTSVPTHKHPEEQTGYLVSGHIILTVDGEKNEMKPGDSWVILGNVEHSAEGIEDSVTVEVFSPVRKDYLPE